MTTRRDFVRTVAAAAATTPLLGRLDRLDVSAPRRLGSLGVQLYTVRDAMRRDVEGTLARVRNIGYREVETAGYFDRTPQQLKAALGNNGLTAPSCHVGLDAVTTRLEDTLGAAQEIGHR